MRSTHSGSTVPGARVAAPRVLVVGDVMLDRAVEGTAGRISPEAPVPVLTVTRTVERPGGAGNVCAAVAAAGGRVRVVGCVGDDEAGRIVRRLLADRGVACDVLADLPGHPTTVKTRLVAGHHQIARYDVERIGIPDTATRRLRALAAGAVAEADVVILSDYAKGVCDTGLCAAVIDAGAQHGIPVIVDPKTADLSRYRGATVITPNRTEAAAAAGHPIDGVDAAVAAARSFIDRHAFGAVVVTLGELGMVAVSSQETVTLPARAREVFDVTGAGDTVIAVLALALAGGVDLRTACDLANTAAGIKVGRPGTATVAWEEIMAALRPERSATARPAADKCVSLEELRAALDRHRQAGRTIGFTNGCFDILHHGHIALFEAAAAECDVLVVGLNADASVERLKGWPRPYVPAAERAAVLAALASVSYVVEFAEDTPAALIAAVAPDVLVKGADYSADTIVGAEAVRNRGGRVLTPVFVAGASTTGIVERIQSLAIAQRGAA
jgi:D-beta-D-heptose 7-phosphate kinase/D-beta-D-heptose 1-phosphate adenosyltransferase